MTRLTGEEDVEMPNIGRHTHTESKLRHELKGLKRIPGYFDTDVNPFDDDWQEAS